MRTRIGGASLCRHRMELTVLLQQRRKGRQQLGSFHFKQLLTQRGQLKQVRLNIAEHSQPAVVPLSSPAEHCCSESRHGDGRKEAQS